VTPATPLARPALARRLWTYQRERFPLLPNGTIVALLVLGAHALSVRARGGESSLDVGLVVAAFGVALGFFLLLRICDEAKDAEVDRRSRPERPVPRGLVTLGELGVVGVLVVALQAGIALLVRPALLLVLAPAWGWLALMTWEFGVGRWLRAHPVLYAATHLPMVVWIHWVVVAFEAVPNGAAPSAVPVSWLVLGYAAGATYEIGRKMRAPEDERAGADTWSGLWGAGGAARAGSVAVVVPTALALARVAWAGAPAWTAVLPGLSTAAALLAARDYARCPTPASARRVGAVSALVVSCAYVVVGPFPLLVEVLR
jgi:4-hydroxybenzoate polyprenyltransferase